MPSGSLAESRVGVVCRWALGALAFGLLPAAAIAQVDPVAAIKAASTVDVPLVLESPASAGAASGLWVKGGAPANPLLATLSARPVQVAAMVPSDAGGTPEVLWRAFAGGKSAAKTLSELRLQEGPRMFCGAATPRGTACWIDKDGNGSFDQMALGVPERGARPYHVTIIRAAEPLSAPVPYRVLPDADRPAIPLEIRNCDKDYDRPRFTARSTVDRAIPLAAGEWHQKDSSFAYCRRGSQITPTAANLHEVPPGGYLGRIGPLTFAVGPKKSPTLRLLGLADPAALYRLEGADLVALSVGPTPRQAQLTARQEFPYPVLMALEGTSIHDGPLAAGQVLATVPFRHAYRGKLTQDITIQTLLGKRSVGAGTVVYGFPARQSVSYSMRVGYGPATPVQQAKGESEYRDATMALTWCAPVQDTTPAKGEPKDMGRGGWTASCMPYSQFGNHTIINKVLPAFNVTGVAYDVNTSSNEGPPPIERNDAVEFAAPLRLFYTFEGVEGDFILLSQKIYFGEELTSQSMMRIYVQGGRGVVNIAGAGVQLAPTGPREISVSSSGKPVTGSDAVMGWDQTALLRQQLQKMGLRMQAAEGDDAAGQD